MRRPLVLLLATVAAVASACAGPTPDTTTFGGDRPTELVVPSDYEHGTETPLLLTLHGYGSNGRNFAEGTGIRDLAEAEGFLLLSPDGTQDRATARFWDATDACCNFGDIEVDDVAYLTGLVDEVSAAYSVDPGRIHIIGFSNGAFMAHRLACERPDTFASIVAVAGSIDEARNCAETGATSVLSIHGTNDSTINFEGGAQYPGATDTTAAWARELGCGPGQPGEPFDLDELVDGPETQPLDHEDCRDDTVVSLWSVEGADHGIAFVPGTESVLWAWLGEHASG